MAIIMDGMYIQDIIQNDIPLTEIWCNGVKVWPENKDITYMWIIPEEDVTISYVDKTTYGIPSTPVTKELLYSFDASTWNSLSSNGISVSERNVVYFKSNTTDGFGVEEPNTYYYQYKGISVKNSSLTYGNYIVGGNMNSLFNGSLSVPARGLAYFFYGERGMKTARLVLPMTTLGEKCYYKMFENCTSLKEAPALPATTLASNCYDTMFQSCVSLTKAPVLHATTLAESCYNGMFFSCGRLKEAPVLPATTLTVNCYNSMFSGCSALTSAPSLPATTLASGCYSSMFSGCPLLTGVPLLPATSMTPYCYRYMFSGCTALKFSETQTAECPNAYRIPTSGSGTTANYWNKDMLYGTSGTFTGDPTIDITYYTNATVV